MSTYGLPAMPSGPHQLLHVGLPARNVRPADGYAARHLGHLLFQAADAAYLQAARNFAFRTNQRTTP